MVQRKRLVVGDRTYWPGDLVPEATSWRTLRSYLDAGILVEIEDEAPSPVEAAGEEPQPLEDMTKAEIRAMAEELGVELPARASKAEMIALLRGDGEG